jgi:dihydrodipicolinate synthase/N-acetylneuraminate lyase
MFASISKFYTAVKTAVASALAKRWVKVVGITGVVTVLVGGAALLFPAAAAAVVGAVIGAGKAVGSFFSGLFTKEDGGAAAPASEAGSPVAA